MSHHQFIRIPSGQREPRTLEFLRIGGLGGSPGQGLPTVLLSQLPLRAVFPKLSLKISGFSQNFHLTAVLLPEQGARFSFSSYMCIFFQKKREKGGCLPGNKVFISLSSQGVYLEVEDRRDKLARQERGHLVGGLMPAQ